MAAIDAPSAAGAANPESRRGVDGESRLRPVEDVAVYILSSSATFVAVACAVVLLSGGPSKKLDTALWVLAFAVALPLGTYLGARQARSLAEIPRPISHWALACGACLLALGLMLLRLLGTGSPQITVLGLMAAAAYGITDSAARRPRIFGALQERPAWAPIAVGVSGVAIMIGLFLVPHGVAAPFSARPLQSLGLLVAAVTALLVIAGIALAAVLIFDRWTLPARRRRLFDLGLCVLLMMIVFQVEAPPPADMFFHHHDFYLGPLNDMAHGRTMLVDVWAQYGVGVYYALLAALSVLPLNHGGLVLLLSTLMVAQYVLVFGTLRMAVRSQALVITAMVAAVMTNIFASMGSYVVYPSTGPLRFGFPYVIVAAAVSAARWPKCARAMQVGQLVILGIAAVWSFETFMYTGATWFALTALRAFRRTGSGLRVFVRDLAAGAAVAIGALLALTIGTRIAAGAWPDWAGYLAYIRLYSVDEFGNLPLDFWSPGLLMAAVIFLSAVGVVWLARDDRGLASAPVLAGLAGFTGFAAASFTYFLGRSHPNNLLNLMVPVCALGCLWASMLLVPREKGQPRWRVAALGLVLVVAVALTALGLPFAVQKWHGTAFAHAVPFADGHRPDNGGLSLRSSLDNLWAGRTFEDSVSDNGARLLQRYDGGNGPALVVAPSATEILLKVHRVNVLPISNPEEDTLVISREWPRISAAIDAVPDGTILLMSTVEPPPNTPIMQRSLAGLQQRFYFQVLASSADGFQVIRLHSRR